MSTYSWMVQVCILYRVINMILDIHVHILLICDICVYRQRARERKVKCE